MQIYKNILLISNIRPDIIRLSALIKKLDINPSFKFTWVHSGQHYDYKLFQVFLEELNLREPNYNLNIGGSGKEHFHQTAELSIKLIELIREKQLNPDIILMLGDANGVCIAPQLKKEGYKIGHIEGAMRSFDKNMLEEINRIVCDHCSDMLFVYHENYKQKALKENINPNLIYVVGNTIVEVCKPFVDNLLQKPPAKNHILIDIHRPENFKYENRLRNIIKLCIQLGQVYNIKLKMLKFSRTFEYIKKFNIDLENIEVVDLMSYKEYLESVYRSLVLVSDSGTAQEEPALLNVPVIVPRDYTERPESMENNCSILIDVNSIPNIYDCISYLRKIERNEISIKTDWLGDGFTVDRIINSL